MNRAPLIAILIVVAVLSSTAALKVNYLVKLGSSPTERAKAFVRSSDPVIPFLNNAQSMLVAIVLELATLFVVLSPGAERVKWMLVAWLGSVFLAYRCGLLLVGHTGDCNCLGGKTLLGLTTAGTNGLLTLLAMALVSIGFILHRRA